MDEKSMILEQERQQKAKKRKKYKKWKWIAGTLVVVLVIGGIWYGVQGRYLLTETDNTVEIVAGEGQEIVYARIDSINGNEITYTVTDMTVMNQNQTQGSDQSSQNGSRTEGMEMPDGMDFSEMGEGQMPDMGGMDFSGMGEGQMPDMSGMDFSGMGEGQMPDMSGMDFSGMGEGQMPDMSGMDFSGMGEGQMPDMSGMDSGMGNGQKPGRGNAQSADSENSGTETTQDSERGRDRGNRGQSAPDMEKGQTDSGNGEMLIGGKPGDKTDNEQSAEPITTYIPVGTEVTTKLGTVTTFSRLAAGDYVALVMEQIIMAVYIIG